LESNTTNAIQVVPEALYEALTGLHTELTSEIQAHREQTNVGLVNLVEQMKDARMDLQESVEYVGGNLTAVNQSMVSAIGVMNVSITDAIEQARLEHGSAMETLAGEMEAQIRALQTQDNSLASQIEGRLGFGVAVSCIWTMNASLITFCFIYAVTSKMLVSSIERAEGDMLASLAAHQKAHTELHREESEALTKALQTLSGMRSTFSGLTLVE